MFFLLDNFWRDTMPGHYKPVIVVIKKPKQKPLSERSLELPLEIYPEPSQAYPQPESPRGVITLNIYGDEKI
tara:strand:- start:481 stop:696 length:216 start_codon:yes stop_codon:yes gene_type:complete